MGRKSTIGQVVEEALESLLHVESQKNDRQYPEDMMWPVR